MNIIQKKKALLENDVTSSNNPDSISGIYFTAAKLAQYKLVDENKREKEETKKETSDKTASPKLCIKKKGP